LRLFLGALWFSRFPKLTLGFVVVNAVIYRLQIVVLVLLTGSLSTVRGGNDPAGNASRPPLLLSPARVFDTADGQCHAGWVVLVTSNHITAAGPAAGVNAPADAQTVPLPGMTLLPGLMDIHSHIFLHPYNETSWNDQVLKEPLAYRTVEAVIHVRETLMAGFTLLRDLGTEGPGPRTFPSSGRLKKG